MKMRIPKTIRIIPYGPVPSRGFSLVEVMIAMVVLSIGLLGMVGMMGVAIKANGYSGKMSLATRSAQEKLEELKNLPFAAVTSGSDAVDPDGLTRSWVVTANTPIVNTSTVVAKVTWTDQNGASRTVQFSTVISP